MTDARDSLARAEHVAWTGHRPEYFAEPAMVERRVQRLASDLARWARRALAFHCGGQRGVDTWAAEAAQALKLPLHLYLPVPVADFAREWPSTDVARLERAWATAAERIVVDPSGTRGPAAYTARNRLLAERCDRLIAVWTGLGGGGTAETIAFARALGRPVDEHRFAPSGRVPRLGERGV